jgi:hypothetical protein
MIRLYWKYVFKLCQSLTCDRPWWWPWPRPQPVALGVFDHRIDFLLVCITAVWMAGAPFTPEPHLVEKLHMLFQATLTRPLDIFDLLMHAAPSVFLAVKLARRRKATN